MEMTAAQRDTAGFVYLGLSLLGLAWAVRGGGHSRAGGCGQTAVLPAPLPAQLAPCMATAPGAAGVSSSGQGTFPLLTHEASCRPAVVYK